MPPTPICAPTSYGPRQVPAVRAKCCDYTGGSEVRTRLLSTDGRGMKIRERHGRRSRRPSADAENEFSQEEVAEACLALARPRNRNRSQGGRDERPPLRLMRSDSPAGGNRTAKQ